MIKWKRSDDGYVDSHCGKWEIAPVYAGRCNPIWYTLRYVGDGMREDMATCNTHKEAKVEAQRLTDKAAQVG